MLQIAYLIFVIHFKTTQMRLYPLNKKIRITPPYSCVNFIHCKYNLITGNFHQSLTLFKNSVIDT